MFDKYEYGQEVVLLKDVANLPGLEIGKIYEIDHPVYGESGISGYRIREGRNDPDRWRLESWFVYPEEIASVKLVSKIDSDIINEKENSEVEEVTYKVGDIVRVVQETNGGNFGVGYVGKITIVDSSSPLMTYQIDNEWWYSRKEIEHSGFVETVEEVSEDCEAVVNSVIGIPVYDHRDYEWKPIEDITEQFIVKSEQIGMELPKFTSHIKMGGTLVEEKIFSHDRYNEIVEDVIHQIKELSEKKGGEYAGDEDRLANFRRNARDLELNMEDIWRVYSAKHWDAIGQYVKDLRSGKKRERLESISGRAHDLIVYLILFLAMVEERNN